LCRTGSRHLQAPADHAARRRGQLTTGLDSNCDKMEPMSRLLVIGPGAIGLVAATALLDQGHDVTIAARTTFETLMLTDAAGKVSDRQHTAPVFTDPDAVDSFDVVFLATKAHQTAGAAPWLHAAVDRESTVVVLQNGIEHETRVRPLIPDQAAVVPVVVNCPASRSGPGQVRLGGQARFTAPSTPAAAATASLFNGAFLNFDVVEDWHTAAWIKLLMNSSTGILGVLTGQALSVLQDPDAAALAVALIDEAAVVARADGADLPADIAARLVDGMLAFAGDHLSSIAADRAAGNPTEWDARNQVILRLAERHGIDVPLHRAGTTLIRLGERP